MPSCKVLHHQRDCQSLVGLHLDCQQKALVNAGQELTDIIKRKDIMIPKGCLSLVVRHRFTNDSSVNRPAMSRPQTASGILKPFFGYTSYHCGFINDHGCFPGQFAFVSPSKKHADTLPDASSSAMHFIRFAAHGALFPRCCGRRTNRMAWGKALARSA